MALKTAVALRTAVALKTAVAEPAPQRRRGQVAGAGLACGPVWRLPSSAARPALLRNPASGLQAGAEPESPAQARRGAQRREALPTAATNPSQSQPDPGSLGQAHPEGGGSGPDGAAALRRALAEARRELAALVAQLDDGDGDGAGGSEILGFQLAMLEDPSLAAPAFAALEQAGAQGPTAEAAWLAALDAEIAPYLSDADEHFRARASDLIDLRERVRLQLLPPCPTSLHTAPKPAGAVLLATDLLPSQFLSLDWSGGGAIVLAEGSSASHVALLARSRAIPMLVGTGEPPPQARFACVDGEAGEVIFDPEPASLATFQARLDAAGRRKGQVALPLDQPARTATGEAVTLLLNIDDPAQLRGLDPRICDGIGLARSEFLFTALGPGDPATGLPDEDTQTQLYSELLRWAEGRPVTVRSLDLGGDKPQPGLQPLEIDPALGLRGLRLSLLHPEGFVIQLRALARAACDGDLRVLLPMVTLPQEFEAAATRLDQALAELEAAGVPCRRPALGVMLEVPAAAWAAERFAADFYAIGSNDLSQYTLAAGRSHADLAALQRAGWPVVLELIGLCIKAAERRGRPICLCGEAATDPDQLEDLLSAGLRAISVPPPHLATVHQVIGAHGA